MPIVVRYLNDPAQECTIRPTPFVSIATNIDKTGAGDAIGTTYNITLTGTILPGHGFPYARDVNDMLCSGWKSVPTIDGNGDGIPNLFEFEAITPIAGNFAGPQRSFDTGVGHSDKNDARQQYIPWNYRLDAIFFKQRVLRSLFSLDGQRLEISPVHNDEPAIICYPRFVSIDFAEGLYFEKCDYTVNLVADTLLDKNLQVHDDGNPRYLEHTALKTPPNIVGREVISGAGSLAHQAGKHEGIGKYRGGGSVSPPTTWGTDADIIGVSGAFISNASESWAIEVDESAGEGMLEDGRVVPRTYRISHNISANGKPHYYPSAGKVLKKESWESARDYVQARLIVPSGAKGYPNVFGQIGSGSMNLIDAYGGFNHVRTEEVGMTEGSYSITENWVLSTGLAHEQYTMNLSTDTGSPFVGVSIEGTVKGMSNIRPSGKPYGGKGSYNPDGSVALVNQDMASGTAYDNALSYYHRVSNSGLYGFGSDIYKRANKLVAVQLNSQPNSISIGLNEFAGDINYNLSFDNRPANIISGVISENITVNDTYPGDVMAVVPVIGRQTGPVLQYIGGRTEYKRDVSLEIVMDYTDLPYGNNRNSLVLMKPSLVEPTKSQIRNLIKTLSPEQEPGVRKYFIAPPTENWVPKEGRYSFNISWVYEMDK